MLASPVLPQRPPQRFLRIKTAGLEDEHGSVAPFVGGLSGLLPLPYAGLPGAIVAAREAPPGREFIHGLSAGIGGAAGSTLGQVGGGLGGGVLGGVGGALASVIARAVLGRRPSLDALIPFSLTGASIGSGIGALHGAYRGGFAGTQAGQAFARRGDPLPAQATPELHAEPTKVAAGFDRLRILQSRGAPVLPQGPKPKLDLPMLSRLREEQGIPRVYETSPALREVLRGRNDALSTFGISSAARG
jgi:hypothetical protein